MMNKGFTVIEMLITIGVLTILSGILILYSHSGESTSVLLREAAKITNDIDQAKNLAITTATFTTSDGQQIHPCGYGVYFDQPANQYIIFADLSQDCQASSHLRDSSGNGDAQTITLTKPLTFKSLDINQVFFLPPDPTVYFQPPAASEVQIILEAPNGANIGIKMNTNGQISTF